MEALLKKREGKLFERSITPQTTRFYLLFLLSLSDVVAEYAELTEVKSKDSRGKLDERLAFLVNEISKLNRRISQLQGEMMASGAGQGKEILDQIMYHIRLLSPIEARKILQLTAEDAISLKLDGRKKDAHVRIPLFSLSSFSFLMLDSKIDSLPPRFNQRA